MDLVYITEKTAKVEFIDRRLRTTQNRTAEVWRSRKRLNTREASTEFSLYTLLHACEEDGAHTSQPRLESDVNCIAAIAPSTTLSSSSKASG